MEVKKGKFSSLYCILKVTISMPILLELVEENKK